MSYLVRTRSGPFTLEEAATLEELAAGKAPLLSPARALGSMPRVVVTGRAAERLKHGVAPALRTDHEPGTTLALVDEAGDLLALAEAAPQGIKLRKVFN